MIRLPTGARLLLDSLNPLTQGLALCLLPLPAALWLDMSGLANHGTLGGSPPPGWRPNGLDFAGSWGQRVNCGSEESLDNLTQKTVSVRAYIRSPGEGGSFGRLVDKAQANGWRLTMSGAKFNLYHAYSGGGLNNTSVNTFAVPGTHHVVFTFDTADYGRFRIWVNGRWEGVTGGSPSGTYLDDSSGSLFVGNNSAYNRTFDGVIEHVMIWRRLLGDAEVRALSQNPYALLADWPTGRVPAAAPPLIGR